MVGSGGRKTVEGRVFGQSLGEGGEAEFGWGCRSLMQGWVEDDNLSREGAALLSKHCDRNLPQGCVGVS